MLQRLQVPARPSVSDSTAEVQQHFCVSSSLARGPLRVADLYDMNAPFVETLEQATHFKRGPEVYEGCISPWKEPITSPYRERVEQGLAPYEVNGDWPWHEAFFPTP